MKEFFNLFPNSSLTSEQNVRVRSSQVTCQNGICWYDIKKYRFGDTSQMILTSTSN